MKIFRKRKGKTITREGYRALRYTDVRPDPARRPVGQNPGTQLCRLCPSAAGDGAGTRGGGADPSASGHGPGSDGGNGAAALRNGDAGAAPAPGAEREKRGLLCHRRGAGRHLRPELHPARHRVSLPHLPASGAGWAGAGHPGFQPDPGYASPEV